MSILIGKHEFEGPFKSINDLKEEPGLYAVLHFERNEYELIHVAQAHNIKDQIELSPMTDISSRGTILLAVCYTPESGRRERTTMIEDIQKEFSEEGELATKHSSVANQPTAAK